MINYGKMNAVLGAVADVRRQLDKASESIRDGNQGELLKQLRDAAVGISDIAEQVQHGQVCHICTDYPPDMHRQGGIVAARPRPPEGIMDDEP